MNGCHHEHGISVPGRQRKLGSRLGSLWEPCRFRFGKERLFVRDVKFMTDGFYVRHDETNSPSRLREGEVGMAQLRIALATQSLRRTRKLATKKTVL